MALAPLLRVGGLKEKSLAAKRAGIKTILLPAKNKRDLEEIDKNLIKGLKFIFVETIDDVLAHALLKGKSKKKPAKKAPTKSKKSAKK